MGIVRTLSRVLIGFVLACLAAALVQVLYVSTPAELAAVPAKEFPTQASSVFELVLKAATHFFVFSMAFALIAAGIAEWLGLRSPVYWLMVGAGIGLLGFTAQYSSEVAGQPTILNNYALQSFLTAGFFGGLVYWLFAGARSGAGRQVLAGGTDEAPGRPRILVEKDPRDNEVKKGSLAERLALKRNKPASKEEPLPVIEAAPAPDAPATKEASRRTATTAVPVTKPEPVPRPGTPGPAETRNTGAPPPGAQPVKTVTVQGKTAPPGTQADSTSAASANVDPPKPGKPDTPAPAKS